MAKTEKKLQQICFPTDIIMDYDPKSDVYYLHAQLMNRIVEAFKKEFGVNKLKNNPHMKCYLMDEKEEEIVQKKFRFGDLLRQEVNVGAFNAAIVRNPIQWHEDPIPPIIPPQPPVQIEADVAPEAGF